MAATGIVLTPQAAQAAPGTPGTPQANTVVFQESFENGTGTTPVGLASYTGVNGEKYTADAAWLANCNGQVRNFNTPYTTLGNCVSTVDSANLGQLAYALGVHAGDATPADNHAVTAYTENNPGANAVEFRTVNNIPLASASGRFLTFSVDGAAVNCNASAPQYQFAFVNQGGTATNVGGVINACSSGTTVNAPANGPVAAQPINVGTYTSNGSVLFNGSTLGIRMTNANGTGVGNDAAFDNIKILDVTPQLDKSFSPATVPTGGTSTLTFTVTNTSELAAKNGWGFTDTLPAGLTVAGAVGGTCNATTSAATGATSIAVTNGVLAAGESSCTITVPVTSTTTGSYTNGPDNVAQVGLNPPGTTTVTFESPALTLVKHAGTPVDVNGDGITDAGDTIQYTFAVTNTGDVPITNVAVNDSKAGAVTCPSTSLAARASETCSANTVYTITAADATAGSVDNTATASGASPSGATVTSPPSSTHTPATTAAPALTVVKSADPSGAASYTPGQVITYHFTVTNSGNLAMNDVGIDETAFSGSGTISNATCPSATLAPGAQEVCTATYTLTPTDVDNGSLTNTATAHGTPPGSDTPVPSDPSTVTSPETPATGISVVKTADPGTVSAAGQTITYSFKVTNTGNVTLNNPTVNETGFSGTGTLSPVSCPETTLVAGQVETCTATYTVTQADVNAGTIDNTATATATPPGGTPVTSTPSTSTVTATRTPALSLVKKANVAAAEVGQQVTYSFAITNTGNVTIENPTVTDTEFSGTGQLSAISCPQVTLQPGDHTTCTATYTVTQADVDAGKLTNTATATGTPPDGTDTPTSPPSTSTVTTNPHPALSVVKTANTQQVTKVGQVVTYTFAVSNTGNVDITNPKVNEGNFTGHGTLSAVTCPGPSTLPPGQTIDCTATYTVVAADLAGGSLSNTATVTGTPQGGGDPITSTPSTATVQEVPPAPTPAAGSAANGSALASTGSDVWTVGIVGFGLLVLGLLAAAAAWIHRRHRLS
ncbi:MAG: beta strand repeat-containing protein [Humibacter sp.]